MEGAGRGLIKVISRHLSAGTEENNKNRQSGQSPWNETEVGISFTLQCGYFTRVQYVDDTALNDRIIQVESKGHHCALEQWFSTGAICPPRRPCRISEV
jgi:hypothetical protein